MRHRLMLAVFLAVALIGTSAFAAGDTPRRDFTESPAESVESTAYMVVTFTDPPAAQYEGGIPGLEPTKPPPGLKLHADDSAVQAYREHLLEVHDKFRGYLGDKAPKAEVVREYFYVLNGVAVKLNGTNPDTIQGGPGVARAGFSALYQPTMNVSAPLINADDVWAAAGGRAGAGAGIDIGIIDTGIDDTHRFFACKDGDGDGRADIPHKVYTSGVAGDTSQLLFFDHGTHVSGTAAGCVITLADGPITGTISGIAPGASLYDYNVFPGFGAGFVAFGGSAFSHDIAAALEDTVADGMDVVNMSLGGSVDGPHDFLAEAVDATAAAGVVVAVAAGNSGPGDATVESPGSAPGALTAGASTNGHTTAVIVEVTPDVGSAASYQGAAGDFDPYTDNPVFGEPLADWADTGGDITACNAAPDPSAVTDTVAVISRGACTFTTKIRNAENAGAIGVIIYNNVAGPPIAMAHDGTDPFPTIPAVMISKSDGADLLNSLPGTTTIEGPPVEVSATPDVLAGFSSRGPTPFTYLIKPDVTAPGVNVYSSVFDDEFALFQGTSMATPHLAGSSALLLEAHPGWSPADVKSALVNTAVRVVTDSATGTVDPGVLARGGGRVDLAAAVDTPLVIDPASASFGLWNGNKVVEDSLALAIRNVSGSAQSCAVSVTGPDIVSTSTTGLSLAAGASTSISLTLDAGKKDDTGSGDYEGDVVITCGSDTLQVPWWVRIDRQAGN